MSDPKEFDYLKTAEDIAKLLPWLAKFESPEMAIASTTMTECVALVNSMSRDQFLVSCAVALTFNVQQSPADNTLDDVSDEYLRAHPEKQKQLEDIVHHIEDLSGEGEEGMKG